MAFQQNLDSTAVNPKRYTSPNSKFQDCAGVGTGGQKGVFCEVAGCYTRFGRLPGFFAFGKFGIGQLDVDFVFWDVDFDYVTIF
jgi:hypothetical protein